jgi:hypothetical protein
MRGAAATIKIIMAPYKLLTMASKSELTGQIFKSACLGVFRGHLVSFDLSCPAP